MTDENGLSFIECKNNINDVSMCDFGLNHFIDAVSKSYTSRL